MTVTRKSLAAVGCALLLAVSVACGGSERADVGTRARQSVDRLGEWEAVSVTARVEAPAGRVRDVLRRGRERGARTVPSPDDARLLARTEVAFAFGADRPLREVDGDRLDTAAALSFGGPDLVGYKSIGTDFYVRVDWTGLAAETGDRHGTVARAVEQAETADVLPPSLAAARDLFRGRWVQIDPEEFDHFARAVGGAYGERAQRLANSVDLLQSAEAQHHLIGSVRRALDEHATFRDVGHADGAERIDVLLPARALADDLSDALEPLAERFDGIGFTWLEEAPDREVTVELELRGGTLSGMTVDLGQFLEEGPAEPDPLPLVLTFAPGQVVPVRAPGDAKWLDPQDVMAAVLYGELGSAAP
ncbi:hypothetical protein F0L17_15315 [Streptomyces sp. TRM43335]|uniref:Lipoprotein n=1 Tax=Streptomyces taklimakanensis TaxID=2569853 RepID=A0A6G2BDU7_9ACTN|nr:hypothetical protein [Streptomyces taklimakanensis]MTE20451.1 hypothetical protein [Streptomyces taklimakanensis]